MLKSENCEIRALAAEVSWYLDRDAEAFESLAIHLRSDDEKESKASLRALHAIWDPEARRFDTRGVYEGFHFLEELKHLKKTTADVDRFSSTPGCVRNLVILENK